MPKPSSHIVELAKRGAVARYQELQAELDQLVKMFPELRARTPKVRRETAVTLPVATAADSGRAKAKWSAAARQAVSARMKKYWAARRKAKK